MNVLPANISETITDEMSSGGGVAAWSSRGGARSELAARDLPHAEKLEKFVEDVK